MEAVSTKPAPVRTCLWIALAAVWIGSLANPWTREIQVLTVRLLFGLNGKTVVQGQPPGCVIEEVPDVYLDKTGYADLSRRLGPTADTFILTNENLPPLDSWNGHPLLEWAAIQITAAATDRFTRGTRPPVDYAMSLLKMAQKANPANGFFWVAEANLFFRDNDPDSALDALKTAVGKPYWERREISARVRLPYLLSEEIGMPLHDSFRHSVWRWNYWLSPTQGIHNMLLRAIESGDDDAFSRAAEAVTNVLDVAPTKHIDETPRLSSPIGSYEIIRAVASKVGDPRFKGAVGSPPWDDDVAGEMVLRYFGERLGENRTHEMRDVFERVRKSNALIEAHVKHPDVVEKRRQADWTFVSCALFSEMIVFVFSLFLLAVIAALPFMELQTKGVTPLVAVRTPAFWLRMAIVLLAGAGLCGRVIWLVWQPVGLRGIVINAPPPSHLAEYATKVGVAFLIPMAFLTVNFFDCVLRKKKRSRITWLDSFLAFLWICAAITIAGGYFRFKHFLLM